MESVAPHGCRLDCNQEPLATTVDAQTSRLAGLSLWLRRTSLDRMGHTFTSQGSCGLRGRRQGSTGYVPRLGTKSGPVL